MERGLGLDSTLRLSWDEQRQIAQEAARLSYTSLWTNSGATGRDSFQVCSQWWAASAQAVPGGLTTGISVVPASTWTAPTLAAAAATTAELTGGRFILGIGSGAIYSSEFRDSYGLKEVPILRVVRDYLTTLRGLLNGETVTHHGDAVSVTGLRLGFRPPQVPVYLAALGPQMLRLAGAASDGVALNWCSTDQVAWSREAIAEGATKAGRDPGAVKVVEYIRICVDQDEDVARKSLTKAAMGYAMARPGTDKALGYRGHFGRMGFEQALTHLEDRRDAGASEDELIDDFPRDLLLRVGYFGRPEGAATAFRKLAEGLDTPIVRVVAARPGIESVRAVMLACAPGQVE